MKNVTVSMDDDLYRATRIEAAKAGKSMSKYLAEAVKASIEAGDRAAAKSGRNPQLEAIERFLAGPALNISENGRMPGARERNSRNWQRDIR
ncbi:MAG: hypothetical protein J0H53_03305 [Rhizobiales bacterium]|nr:hypothetical protein [Hyphomicrobiales bacterium]OJU33882.1 MAG: hypothetical protein BGN94_05955 [Rhizobiales bacterium 68-8]